MIPAVMAALALIAMLYASVGHGGASGYLAVLALAGLTPNEVRATALMLNVIVSSIAVTKFSRRVGMRWGLLARFASTAAPCALLAGYFGSLDRRMFGIGVAVVLVFAAWRMALPPLDQADDSPKRTPALALSLPIGACIGVVSGLIGVGGGIFLSPVLLLCRWASAKETAAVSAAFILLSSIAGLTGLAIQLNGVPIDAREFGLFAGAVVFGGWFGASVGAERFSGLTLRRTLAVVLLLAAVKLAVKSW